ncbi:hypothetical protein FOZ60_001391 [Perkinsus olseni]|uniref:Uncharacterized protein n=1 Tax=Perkinsus olseni TaxID=32597 RepID=A0A7J6PJZ9_PEROL|nr:hypothetical protein FOZ60_001391 [Perkinsus olseni]
MCTRAIPRDTTADDMNSVAVQWVHSQQFCSVPSSDTLWERRLASPSRNTTLAPALLQETTSPLVVSSDDRISKAKYATRHFLEFFGRKEGIPATHIVGQEQFDARIYEMASRAAKPDREDRPQRTPAFDAGKMQHGVANMISYVFYSSPTKEPVIQRVQFTRQQGGRVFITAKQGRLPRGQYDCGYRLQQSSGAPRITLTLMDQCAQLVKDSSGYFNNAFLTGSYIENGYQYLYVQTATTGYDVYPLQIEAFNDDARDR